jgi:hypothetical protein
LLPFRRSGDVGTFVWGTNARSERARKQGRGAQLPSREHVKHARYAETLAVNRLWPQC